MSQLQTFLPLWGIGKLGVCSRLAGLGCLVPASLGPRLAACGGSVLSNWAPLRLARCRASTWHCQT